MGLHGSLEGFNSSHSAGWLHRRAIIWKVKGKLESTVWRKARKKPEYDLELSITYPSEDEVRKYQVYGFFLIGFIVGTIIGIIIGMYKL